MSPASEHPTHLLLHQDGVAWLYQLVGVLSDQARHDLESGGDRIEDVVLAGAEREPLREAARSVLACIDGAAVTSGLPPTHTLKINAERLRSELTNPPNHESGSP